MEIEAPPLRRRRAQHRVPQSLRKDDNNQVEGDAIPHAAVTLAFVTLLITLILFYAGGASSHLNGPGFKIPGISVSAGWPPASFVFTAGMHLVAVLLVVAAWIEDAALREAIRAARARSRDSTNQMSPMAGGGGGGSGSGSGSGSGLVRPAAAVAGAAAAVPAVPAPFNPLFRDVLALSEQSATTAWLVSVLMSVSLYAAATVPCTYWGALHNAFATVFFASALMYMHLITNRVLRRASASLVTTALDRAWLRHKRVTLWASVVLILLYLVVFPIVEATNPGGMQCDPMSGDPWCPLESARSVMEFLAAFALFAWFWSLKHDTRGVQMVLLVPYREREERSAASETLVSPRRSKEDGADV